MIYKVDGRKRKNKCKEKEKKYAEFESQTKNVLGCGAATQ